MDSRTNFMPIDKMWYSIRTEDRSREKKEKGGMGGGDACPYAKALRVDIHNIGFVLISFTKVITSPSPSIKKKRGGGAEGADYPINGML